MDIQPQVVQALEGIRILDLSRFLPGNYCTWILAEMGAEVIKIQPTVEPEIPMDLFPSNDPNVVSAYDAMNRNKKSIALNLKTEEGRQVFYKLAKRSDAILEGFRPGVTRRLGADYETVSRVNPRIIYCSITGYGQDGPYQALAGHDRNYLSISGILGHLRTEDGQFVLPNVSMGDIGTGAMQAAVGILVALIAREKTGKGQMIDVSMTDGLIAWVGAFHGPLTFGGKAPSSKHVSPPHVYETADCKYICFQAREPWYWERLCRALGVEEYIPHHREILPEEPSNPRKRKEIILHLSKIFLTKSRDEWFQLLRQADCEVSPTYTELEEAFSDPQILHRRMVVELNHPDLGKVKQINLPLKFSETPGTIRSFAPLLGQHTREIMLDLGYSETEIEELHHNGTVCRNIS